MTLPSSPIQQLLFTPTNTDIGFRRHHFQQLGRKLTIPEGGKRVSVIDAQRFVHSNQDAVLTAVVHEDDTITFVSRDNRDEIAFALRVCPSCLRAKDQPLDTVTRLRDVAILSRRLRSMVDTKDPVGSQLVDLFDIAIDRVGDLL